MRYRPYQALGLFTVVLFALVGTGLLLPAWQFLTTVALAKGMAVLGLMLLLRTGLVSFGQGLFYCLGGYAAGSLGQFWDITDALVLLVFGVAVAVLVAAILGLLMARYRDIFFAMLSLAFSMVLYGLLVKSQVLGSTDGFNLATPTLLGFSMGGDAGSFPLYVMACVLAWLAACGLYLYMDTPLGRLSHAIRDNEIRVEYMGASVYRAIYIKYIIAAALTGAGGVVAALAVGHIDPEMSYWVTSGEFVFVAILAGTGSVLAPFLGSIIFEVARSLATQYSPDTWQMILGVVMLVIILFLPGGLWSVFAHRRREPS